MSDRWARMSEAVALRMCWQLQPCATPQGPLSMLVFGSVDALPRASLAMLGPARRSQRPCKIACNSAIGYF